ncbi:MAG: hypothetical protein WD060_02740 [Pirellulales bacterium]
MPVSDERAVTPVTPPKSEVPAADEESRGPKPFQLPAPEDDSTADSKADTAEEQKALPADAPPPPEPAAMPPEAAEPKKVRGPAEQEEEPTRPAKPSEKESDSPIEPRELPRVQEKLAPATETPPPAPRPEDENLFDDSATEKVRRKIPVMDDFRPAVVGSAGGVQPAAHQPGILKADRPAAPIPNLRRIPLAVPRVMFDPQAETARLRQKE